MSQVNQFTLPDSDDLWKQKCIKLENQLLEARIEEINLKRINRNLEETLKLAMSEDLPETERNSTQRINLTWKEKYEQELEKNLENQKYIKVLETKRNTPSVTKTQKKRQNSTNTRVSFKTENHTRYTPTPLTTIDVFENVNIRLEPRKSVKKMEGFMERLMKQKYSISDFGLGEYVQNYPIEVGRCKEVYGYKDPIEKLFGSVSGIKGKENYVYEAEQEMPLKARPLMSQNRMGARSASSKLTDHKKIATVIPSHLR